MSDGGFQAVGSIEAVRPVFMIVMGVFLLLLGWRLAKTSGVWTSRVLVAGALMLGFGYGVMLPMYEAGVIEKYAATRTHYHGSAETAIGWHAVKLVVMNAGWLVFGLGLAMHASILGNLAPRKPLKTIRISNPSSTAGPNPLPSHEFIA
jgi:hypothetical protein